MGYSSIRIERERDGFEVSCTDPAIQKENDARDKSSDCCAPWKDPNVEFQFETKAQLLKFLDGAIDLALPVDTYTSTFDQLAKDAMK
jgi:hypothetical protein